MACCKGGEIDQATACLGRFAAVNQHPTNTLVINEVREAVAAQKQAISTRELQLIDIDLHVLTQASKRIHEHVTRAKICGFFLRKLPAVDEQLDIGVVSGQAEQVRVRLATSPPAWPPMPSATIMA